MLMKAFLRVSCPQDGRWSPHPVGRRSIFSYIEGWYNPARRHSGIRYLSPIAYETQMLEETQTT
jgi:transposase InsO family protein